MTIYLSEEEIIVTNKLSLRTSDEEEEFQVQRLDDIRFILRFVEERFNEDYYEIALAYCISIIIMHPFKNGNHRTSIICSEHFLLKNNFNSFTTDEKDIELEKWRLDYEKKHDLERCFSTITCIEDEDRKKDEIEKVMNSKYGLRIEKWLKENYKQS